MKGVSISASYSSNCYPEMGYVDIGPTVDWRKPTPKPKSWADCSPRVKRQLKAISRTFHIHLRLHGVNVRRCIVHTETGQLFPLSAFVTFITRTAPEIPAEVARYWLNFEDIPEKAVFGSDGTLIGPRGAK